MRPESSPFSDMPIDAPIAKPIDAPTIPYASPTRELPPHRPVAALMWAALALVTSAVAAVASAFAVAAFTFTGTTHGAGDLLILPLGLVALVVLIGLALVCGLATIKFQKNTCPRASTFLVAGEGVLVLAVWLTLLIG